MDSRLLILCSCAVDDLLYKRCRLIVLGLLVRLLGTAPHMGHTAMLALRSSRFLSLFSKSYQLLRSSSGHHRRPFLARVSSSLLLLHVAISEELGLPLIPEIDFRFSMELLVLHVCLVEVIKHRRKRDPA